MIEFAPHSLKSFSCVRCCNHSNEVREIVFLGSNAIASCYCTHCQEIFYHTIPIGHTIYFPISFDKSGKTRYDEKAKVWLAQPLIDVFLNRKKVKATFHKIKNKSSDNVVILNCLDSCFGHVVAKLLNAQAYLEKHPELGLITIVPKECEFLVPEGASEVWSVDLELKKMNLWIESFDEFLKEEFKRFKKVYLSVAYLHLDYAKVDVSLLTRVRKTSLKEFNNLPLQVTFFFREDRIWVSNKMEDLLLKLYTRWRFFVFLSPFLLGRQNSKINAVKKRINKSIANVNFTIIGVGRKIKRLNQIDDLRSDEFFPAIQKRWWEVLSKTHVLIGMHGSSMIIPTSLSLSFIDLLPRHKIFNYSDDISLSHLTPNVLFFSRFLDIYSSPSLVSYHAIGILRNFKLWNTEINIDHKIWNSPEEIYRSFDHLDD